MSATVVIASCALWVVLLALPWQPWRTRERLEPEPTAGDVDLSRLTVLIPARNEAATLARTLSAASRQGRDHRIIVIDDESTDGTGEIARRCRHPHLDVVRGAPLPSAWTGKLWALEQGLRRVDTPAVLLLDADIELAPGMVAALLQQAARGYELVSVMARLRMDNRWEKLLLPAFVYFFKLLYPFRLANGGSRRVAAAAGGCMLVERRVLERIGGFAAVRDQLIDDCALARRSKAAGFRTWLGLTRGAVSLRPYPGLNSIWQMVARTAYTQLGYSPGLLLLCTLVLLLAFAVPLLGLAIPSPAVRGAALAGLMLMSCSYLPTLNYYGIAKIWALSLPISAMLYLSMTWSSALRYWRGERSRWKERSYTVEHLSDVNH